MSGEHLRGVFQFPQLHDGTLKEMLDAGYTYDEVAAEVGCSRAAIYHAIIRYGLRQWTRPDLEHPLMSDRAAVEAYLRAERPSLAQLSKRFMTSGVTVRMWLRKFDLYDEWLRLGLEREADKKAARLEAKAAERVRRSRGRYPALRDIAALKQAVEERGATAVSKDIGCHVSSVMRALERAGVEYERPQHLKAGAGRTAHHMRERAVILLEAGFTTAEAAGITGMSINAVCNAARASGIPLRRGRPPKARPVKRDPRGVIWV